MAQVKSLIISFEASPSPDVSGYRLFMEEAPAAVGYESEYFDLGNVTEVDLASLEGMTTKSGTYNLGIVAIDGAGNLSSMSKAEGVVIDFVAPDPPGEIVVNRS